VAPGDTGQVVEEAAVALVALGKTSEAGQEAAAVAKVLTGRLRVDAAAVHVLATALLTKVLHHGAPDEQLLQIWEKSLGGPQPHLRVRVGVPPAEGLEGADAVHAALWRDPDKALELAAALPPFAVAQLELDAWALATFEALRRGSPAAANLLAHNYAGARRRPDLQAYLRGGAVALPPGLPLAARAAAQLVRSRVPDLPEAERRELLQAARADDRLGGLVTRASTAWPAAR
jgi:hypothetical protein